MSENKDPKGYYACLGVAPNASSEEIKSSYKQLAKKLHPDINRDSNAKALFQKINEAYQTLSDPDSRSAYDSLRYSKPELERSPGELDPICCSHCGKVTAQPRSTVFFRTISIIVITTTTPIQGIFCSVCASKLGLRASLVSALFGWWGFPWGPIWTISSIFTNARGGRHSQDIDDRLIWYNAMAFFSRGRFAISYALAQQSRKAQSAEIASGANKLISHLQAAGVPTTSPSLKNPWSNPLLVGAHLGLLLLVPGAFGLAIAYDDLSKSSKQVYRAPVQMVAKTDFPQSPTSVPTPTQIRPAPTGAIPTCAVQPSNGKVLSKNIPPIENGHSIEVKNGSTGNAIIKIRDAYSGVLRLSFFVAKGSAASFSGLPDGVYRIQYAFGRDFAVDCRSFAQITSAAQFPAVESLTTEITGTQIITKGLTYTLYTVPGGNTRPQSIDAESFNAN
jgi:curved DNA-binding protein CbpA